jgi:HD-GYP domain-containing protein (c-di-GMP phosphodiesterase class II)
MSINFKKELETAAKNMILVHEPDLLIKMILRMAIQKLHVSHASVLLYSKEKQSYVLTDSRGTLSTRIPVGLARIDKADPLIHLFTAYRDTRLFDTQAIVLDEARKYLKGSVNDQRIRQLLEHVLYQMEVLDTVVSIPSFFGKELLAVLLLGKKKNDSTFSRDELDFFIALSSNMAMAIRNAHLFKELGFELEKKQQLFVRFTISLAATIEAKDRYTHGHTTRVTNLSLGIADKLRQRNKKAVSDRFLEHLHMASLLHDIGKIGIPEYILNKKGDLTIGERNRIKEHPMIGATILQPLKELDLPMLGVKHHHERYDGKGYPDGLKGEQIPLIASIISVADTFDAMTTDRSYRRRLTDQEAISEINRVSGRQLDPHISSAFVELFQEKKI